MAHKGLLRDANLHLIFAITLAAIMGVASITPAFPVIIRHFQIDAHEIGLLITAFTFPGILLTPVFGVMADRLGRKRILVPSLFLFGVGGGLCAFAGTFHALVLYRFLQGIGAASLGSLNITLIGDLYEGARRSRAMGLNASVLSIGTASYPAIGGFLAMLSWQYVFYMPLVAVPLGFIVLYGLRCPALPQTGNFLHYIRSALSRLGTRAVLSIFIANIVMFVILYGSYLTYLPLFMEDAFASAPYQIGIVMSFMSLTTAVVSSQYGRLAVRAGEVRLIAAAFLFYALSMAAFNYSDRLYLLFPAALLFGIGHGMVIPGLQSLLAAHSPMEQRAAFMSINGMVLRIGQTLGPVLMGVFFSMFGFDGAFMGGAGLALIMAVLSVLMMKQDA